MSEIITPKNVESFVIHWNQGSIKGLPGVVSLPCSAVIAGSDRIRYRLRFTAQLVTTQGPGNPPVAYLNVTEWRLPYADATLDQFAFMKAAHEYLLGYAPDGGPLIPLEYADAFFGAVVSDDGTRITAASGWTVQVSFNPASGWIKLTASLGVTRCTVTGEGLTVQDIARLYKVPEGTRRALLKAAGASWPDEPPAEEIN